MLQQAYESHSPDGLLRKRIVEREREKQSMREEGWRILKRLGDIMAATTEVDSLDRDEVAGIVAAHGREGD